MLIDPDGWLTITIDTAGIVSAVAIAGWQHRQAERRACRAELSELRLLLAEGESICAHVSRYGPLAEQQLIRLGAGDFAVRAAQSARRAPAGLRPALAGLAGVADELARSGGFASELRSAVVQDRVVRALAAAIDRAWAEVAALGSR